MVTLRRLFLFVIISPLLFGSVFCMEFRQPKERDLASRFASFLNRNRSDSYDVSINRLQEPAGDRAQFEEELRALNASLNEEGDPPEVLLDKVRRVSGYVGGFLIWFLLHSQNDVEPCAFM